MKVEREICGDKLLFTIEDVLTSSKYTGMDVLEKVKNRMYSRNIMQITRIINNNIPIETLSEPVLYLLCEAFYKYTKSEMINPEIFFTEINIRDYAGFKMKEKEKINEVKFEDFIPIKLSDNQWQGSMYVGDIVSLYNDMKITYNVKTQREGVFREIKGRNIKKPKTFPASISSIVKKIEDDTYIPDEITFNILKNGEEDFVYQNGNLIVKNGEIDVIDGYNRSRALIKLLALRPDLARKRAMEVRITYMDENKAQAFIVQKNKQNKISPKQVRKLDTTKYENTIVRDINTSTMSDLRGKIATDVSELKIKKAVTSFDILSDAIGDNFTITTRREATKISEYLVDFFNEVYGIMHEDFVAFDLEIINDFSFISWTYMAKRLFGKLNWRQKLEKNILNIDYSKYNDFFPTNKRINKKTRHNIYEYVESMLENIEDAEERVRNNG